MKRKTRRILIAISTVVGLLVFALVIPFVFLSFKTTSIKTDYKYLKDDTEYSYKVEIEGLELVTQHISCGYATIEMISSYYGNKVDEDTLSNKNGGAISTSSSGGFLREINESISSQRFVMKNYLPNDILLKEIHRSLKNNNPVALEWAAKYEGEWTLHFSVISALDFANDNITVYNPYGLIESISIDEFINRTTFEAYQNMPLFLNFGFAFGAFDKNTIFVVE